jgi:hypothetical protein
MASGWPQAGHACCVVAVCRRWPAQWCQSGEKAGRCSHSRSLLLSPISLALVLAEAAAVPCCHRRPNTPQPQHHRSIHIAQSSNVLLSTALTHSQSQPSPGKAPRALVAAMVTGAPPSSSSSWPCSSEPSRRLSYHVKCSLGLDLAPAVGRRVNAGLVGGERHVAPPRSHHRATMHAVKPRRHLREPLTLTLDLW